MFGRTMDGFPRAARKAYMSPRAVYASRGPLGAPPQRRTDFYRTAPTPRGGRSEVGRGRPSGAAAGELEPDAGLVLVAMNAPPVRHLVDEHEAEAAGLERVRRHRLLLGHGARVPGVADLDIGTRLVRSGADVDLLVLGHPRVPDAVRHELRDEQQERRLLLGGHETAARHRMARLTGRGAIR